MKKLRPRKEHKLENGILRGQKVWKTRPRAEKNFKKGDLKSVGSLVTLSKKLYNREGNDQWKQKNHTRGCIIKSCES